jgi:hypothetical protein
MNRDSDIPREILLRLLFEPLSAEDFPSQNSPHRSSASQPQPDAREGFGRSSQWLPEEGWDIEFDTPIDADPTAVFDPGDVPVVQTHFESLIKRRLKQEIAQHPPLFPWEKGLHDYPDTLNSDSSSVWLDHLRSLEVPAGIPDDILAELLNQCQRVAQVTQQTGRRLVQAVEALFPDQTQTLEAIAGLVARPAYRSQAQTLQTIDYESASPQKQIALSMLAAQSIFAALSLTVSAAAPTAQQEWMTPAGMLRVQATYRPGPSPQLRITAVLPTAGHLALGADAAGLRSQRDTAGEVVAHLDSPQLNYPYGLTIALADQAISPLSFVVTVGDEEA